MKGLVDSTLREGEQAFGVRFDHHQKLDIIGALARIGIEEIEVGVVGSRTQDLGLLVREARDIAGVGRLALWCRCIERDIGLAAALRPDVLSLSIPVSDLHLEKKMGRSRAWALATVRRSVEQARGNGVEEISVGFEDATRADDAFLLEMARVVAQAGARRVRLADTVGAASPSTLGALVQVLTGNCDLEIGVHAHNDFGMATANTIAALENGAHWADVTVLGLGERAGNACLEEVVAYLGLMRWKREYQVGYVKKLCQDVARMARFEIPLTKPIVGENVFASESGLHLQGLLREPATYEPFAPDKVGAVRCLRFGEKIGRRALVDSVAATGVVGSRLDEMLAAVHSLARLRKRPLDQKELKAVVDQTLDRLRAPSEIE